MNAAHAAVRPPSATPPASLRRIVCCLTGGAHQSDATAVAFDLARRSGARLTGLVGADPAGEGTWLGRVASLARPTHAPEARATALREFQALAEAAAPVLDTALRGGGVDAAGALAGHDLAVVPAGVGPDGEERPPAEEVAALLSGLRRVPVLRVRRRVPLVRAALLVVGATPTCGALAAGLVRTGLWQDAALSILPVGGDRPGVAAAAEAQADLLRDHGRRVRVLRGVDLVFEPDDLRPLLACHDAAVLSCLSARAPGFIGQARACAHEEAASATALALLP